MKWSHSKNLCLKQNSILSILSKLSFLSALLVPLSLIILPFSLLSCSSKPILPDISKVKVSREKADAKCREISVVYGKTLNTSGNLEKEALADLTQNAAIKGANYVFLEEYGAYGNSVKGIAYDCP